MKRIFTWLGLLLPALLVVPAIAQTSNSRNSATIVAVEDGDTLRVNQSGQILTIRMACIDAPELNQPQGQPSARRLQQLLPRNTVVQLRPAMIDRYNRVLAEVYRNGVSVNLQMVQEGRAIVDRRHLYGCIDSRNRYLQVEQVAKQRRLAFWSQTNPFILVDWRNDFPIDENGRFYMNCEAALDVNCPASGIRVFEPVVCSPEWDRECPESQRRVIEVLDNL